MSYFLSCARRRADRAVFVAKSCSREALRDWLLEGGCCCRACLLVLRVAHAMPIYMARLHWRNEVMHPRQLAEGNASATMQSHQALL